jgi:hypothetical protein
MAVFENLKQLSKLCSIELVPKIKIEDLEKLHKIGIQKFLV